MRVATKRPLLAAAALAALALGACVGDDASPAGVVNPANGGVMFQRYVSLGNSITAGYQSGGIVDSLQRNAYPNILAGRASIVRFGQPRLAGPGCPQPFTAPLVPAPASPAGAPCIRVDSSAYTQNLAVPGARIADLFLTPNNPANSFHRLYALITGGKSQVNAMLDAHPTFVSAWIGNNDALAAALGGVLGPTSAAVADSNLTTLASFNASLTNLTTALKQTGAAGVALIGVVDAVTAAPLIQPGAYFFLARDAAGKFNGKPVNNNCSPVDGLGAPNPLAANMVSFQIVSDAGFAEINCDPAAYPVGDPRRGVYLLDTTEQAFVRARIAAYNAAISAAATANNWVYVDPNAVFAPLLAEKNAAGRYQRVRKCQDLPTATTAAAFQAAVLNSCPVTGPTAAPNFFGSIISFDGVHPSTEAHRILATALATAINTKYGTQIATS